jgi:hypothetical protein
MVIFQIFHYQLRSETRFYALSNFVWGHKPYVKEQIAIPMQEEVDQLRRHFRLCISIKMFSLLPSLLSAFLISVSTVDFWA